MSFMDKLKAMFSGGSKSDDHSHDGGRDHDHSAVDDVPPATAAPLDPLGTSMPEAGPVPTSIPPAEPTEDKSDDESA